MYTFILLSYNHSTTNLAIYSNGTSQDKLWKPNIGSLLSNLLSSRCLTNYMKIRSFLHAHFTETIKVDENW